MAEISSTELTAGIAVISVAMTSFTGLLPAMKDVLDDTQTSTMRERIDFGQQASAVATLSTGIALTLITRSLMPLIFSVGTSAIMWLVFEFAYRKGIIT